MAKGRPRFGKFDAKKRAKYLNLLEEGSRRGAAAQACGISRELVNLYRREYPEFSAKEREAEANANEAVEDALFQAAISGNVVAIQVWLYNRDPERWADRRQGVTVNYGLEKKNEYRILIDRALADPIGQEAACILTERMCGLPASPDTGSPGPSGQPPELAAPAAPGLPES